MTLVYFSNCAVHTTGMPDPFMMQEMPWLWEHFDRIVIVGHQGVHTLNGPNEEKISLVRPNASEVLSWIGLPFVKDFWLEMRRMRREGRLTVLNALKLLAFTQRGLKMHYWAEKMLRVVGDSNVTLYSCWMSFDSYAAALCKKKHPLARFVARGHAYDIDTERNPLNPYLMKQRIADEADGLYLISETAKEQYLSYMQGRVSAEKVHVLAMGSSGEPVETCREAPLHTQGVLRIASCAQIIPIKQVPLLAEALSQWEGCPICWTHMGGGEGMEELRALVAEKIDPKENVICELLGAVSPEKVQQLYEARAFDVFINTSRKEGVPISIMEAMRHGTPVIAPRVGGIPELVTPDVGWLYEPQDGPAGVLAALEKLAALSPEETQAMRQSARERWNSGYCSRALLPKLFPECRDIRR